MSDAVTKGAFVELLPAAKPTLRELALLAVRASRASSDHLRKPGVLWNSADEREQARLDDVAHEAKQAMLIAFAEAGFDRQLLIEIGEVAL